MVYRTSPLSNLLILHTYDIGEKTKKDTSAAPFRGGGIEYLNDLDSYAGGCYAPGRGQTKQHRHSDSDAKSRSRVQGYSPSVHVKDPRPTPSWVVFWSKFPAPGFPSPCSVTFLILVAPFSNLY